MDTNPAQADVGALVACSAGELARAIARGERSSVDVVNAHLERIAAVNPAVNALTAVLADSALETAREADRRVAAGGSLGPLHGVPVTIKDNIDVVGSPTTEGIAGGVDRHPTSDAPVVARLREAGAIPIARSNMPDFGLRWHTDNALFGATVNPYDPRLSPGGSSGGEGVAIATGMSPLGIGNDYGGSIRLPAQAGGIVGLRPTLGRVASATSFDPADPPLTIQLMAVDGPMARSVEDVETALRVLRAADPRDPWWTPAGDAESEAGLRVAVTTDPGGEGVDPDVEAGVRAAADALAQAGYAVEEHEPPAVGECARLWLDLVTAEIRTLMLPLMEQHASRDALDYMHATLALTEPPTLGSYMEAFIRRHALAREWSLFQARTPLVLGPVSTGQPRPAGYDLGGVEPARTLWREHRLVVSVNALGLPSLVVPVGRSAAGLPQAVQIIGPRYGEKLCIGAGKAIETALGRMDPIDPRS